MQMFISKAEARAVPRALELTEVNVWEPNARRETDITEMKVPNMVWGRVKR